MTGIFGFLFFDAFLLFWLSCCSFPDLFFFIKSLYKPQTYSQIVPSLINKSLFLSRAMTYLVESY